MARPPTAPIAPTTPAVPTLPEAEAAAAPAEGSSEAPRPPLLARPPEEGARRLALGFLDQAAEARPRLGSDDDEALHDFRVGLRRLRSCLQAYNGELGESVPGKLAKRLERLAAATGEGRDTEVQIEWLRAQAPALARHQRPGLRWLLDRLEARKEKAYGRIEGRVAARFDELAADLRERLSVYTAEVHLDRAAPARRATLGRSAAAILAGEVANLRDRLAAIGGPDDALRAHKARIAAKRLRCLLEPLADELADAGRAADAAGTAAPAAKPLVKRVKALQDLLGELHDAHVLEGELADALAAAAAERAAALYAATLAEEPDDKLLRAERRRARESGILALARLNRERRDRLYREADEGWLGGRADAFLAEVAALGEVLAGA
jgi:CHAD domain-containing protein